ncbi:nucleolin 2-like [Stegastes partitus]|uniref:Nucleolin 2-like n=1 Tax=Stegastes partitus TaxID=144197 RepID=A0A9Y4JLN3_9TELE|nr:PREDICTED: nucleolin 2-like [Stegastes partitus]
MAKGKAKNSNGEDFVPPQPPSLRSRKRECPSDHISLTDDVQATVHQQDTEGNNTAVVSSPPQSPPHECAMITNQQDQGAKQSDLTKPDDSIVKKHTEAPNEAANIYLTNMAVTGQEEEKEPKNDSHLEGFRVDTEPDINHSGKNKEEEASEEGNRSTYQACTDQLLLSITEEDDGSSAAALEKELGAKASSNLERNQETDHSKPSTVCTNDVKELTKESAAGLPAKKKRRMGMCGLTERERSQFLLTQKRESGPNGMERAEKQICNNTSHPLALAENKSSPTLPPSPVSIAAECITEQSETELQLQSSHCGGDDSAETKVLIAATVSDGTGSVCDPGCSEVRSCEAEGGTVPGPEQTGNPESDPLPEKEDGECLENKELKELKGSTAEVVAEIPQKQRKEEEEEGSAEVNYSSAITFSTKEESENRDAIEATLLQVNSVTMIRDEKKEATTGEAVGGDGAEEAETQSGGLNCGSVELREAAVTHSVSERNDNCDPDDKPAAGSPAVSTENTQNRDTADPFGSGCLDYVSDSQLNTIILIDEKMMEKEESDSSECLEDASDLICGLIRELSALNRRVMATHRELENLRRGSKGSRSPIR